MTTPPAVQISNGLIQANLYLPNPDTGYYRGARFDWSGVISHLEYAGHSYFGVWFPHYDPTLHDAITGPVNEFRSSDGALGFGEAAPNDFFVKIGVGLLRKPDNEPYAFTRSYQIADTGKWVIRPGQDRVEFIQTLKGVRGYSYLYKKTVRLARNKPELVLEYSLKNTGSRSIDTEVYNHDFYTIDGQPTGPDLNVRFTFAPQAQTSLGDAARIEGKEVLYTRPLQGGESVASYLTGYSQEVADNDIKVENSKTHAGVQEITDRPISKLYLWSIKSTVCPEAYIALHIPPGKTSKWQTTYRFYTTEQTPKSK